MVGRVRYIISLSLSLLALSACGSGDAPIDVQAEPDVFVSADVSAPVTSCSGIPDDTPCDDGDPCSLWDRCEAGICVASTNNPCESLDPCTLGHCDSATGACIYVEATEGSSCEVACFSAATCVSGECQVDGSSGMDCTADYDLAKNDEPCLAALSCDVTSGGCTERIYLPEGGSCNSDGNACTMEACSGGGVCVDLGETESCATARAFNPCEAHLCNPETGTCESAGFAGPIACDDNNGCTMDDQCVQSEFGFHLCKGTPLPLSDGNPCTDDQCKAGTVSHVVNPGLPCPALTDCSDAWLCSDAGACLPGAPNATCDAGLDCVSATCDGEGSSCLEVIANGSCLLDFACLKAGDVDPENPCRACDPSQSQTEWTFLGAGVTCDDADACTAGDTCNGAGACSAGTAIVCLGAPCVDAACNPADGLCETAVKSGFCFIDGACLDDGFVPDSGPCAFCDAAFPDGWSFVSVDAMVSCGNTDVCAGVELCDGQGACMAQPAKNCDDGDDCTLDTCVEEACVHTTEAGCPIMVASPTAANLRGVWGDGTGTVWAVGEGGTLLVAEDGEWFAVPLPDCAAGLDLVSIDGSAWNDMWIGASDERLIHFDGTAFNCSDPSGTLYQLGALPGDFPVYKVWAGPETFLAFRYLFEAAGYFLHMFDWGMGAWENIVMAAGFSAQGIAARPVVACAANNVIVSTFPDVALGQTDALLKRFTGSVSLTILNPTPSNAGPIREMRAGVCFADDDVMMVGHQGQVTHWTGTGLAQTNLYDTVPSDQRPTLWALGGGGSHPMVAVGDWGSVAREGENGWEELTPATDQRLTALWVGPQGTVWIVGHAGVILRIDNVDP